MSQTNAQLLADSLGNASTGTVPIGGIILWSGSVASIPGGYALCNGSNGTPNLQDRFVVGAGSGYAVAATGGNATVTLTTAQMPQHNHGSRVTSVSLTTSTEKCDKDPNNSGNLLNDGTTLSVSSSTMSNKGSSEAHENRPPYYALAYIMRTS